MTSTTFPSASRTKSIIDGQQNICTSQIFSPSLKTRFRQLFEFLKFVVTSGNKVRLQSDLISEAAEVVKEQMKTQLGLMRTGPLGSGVIYCEGEKCRLT